MLKERIFDILDSFDHKYEELKETNKELNSKHLKLQDEFTKHQEKYTRFLSALNLRLLPKILENKELTDVYCECFDLLNETITKDF